MAEHSSDEVRFRRAAEGDVEAVTELVQRAYDVYLTRLGLRPGPMDDDYGDAIRTRETWVAESGERIVGLLVLVLEDEALLLDNVAVDPEAQGRGIGRSLLALAERRAREAALPVVRLYTNVVMEENQRLYESLGYVETRRAQEDGHGRVFYEKPVRRRRR